MIIYASIYLAAGLLAGIIVMHGMLDDGIKDLGGAWDWAAAVFFALVAAAGWPFLLAAIGCNHMAERTDR